MIIIIIFFLNNEVNELVCFPEAMSGPAAERKTRDQPLPVMEAGTGTMGGMRSSGCGCLPDWEQYGSRCFKLFTTPMNWINAEVKPDTKH